MDDFSLRALEIFFFKAYKDRIIEIPLSLLLAPGVNKFQNNRRAIAGSDCLVEKFSAGR